MSGFSFGLVSQLLKNRLQFRFRFCLRAASVSGFQFRFKFHPRKLFYCEVKTDYFKSAAWRNGSERRFYDDHDRKVDGSPPNLVSLLRPWIRCFTMIISAWWNLASSKLKKSEENSSGKLGKKGNS